MKTKEDGGADSVEGGCDGADAAGGIGKCRSLTARCEKPANRRGLLFSVARLYAADFD